MERQVNSQPSECHDNLSRDIVGLLSCLNVGALDFRKERLRPSIMGPDRLAHGLALAGLWICILITPLVALSGCGRERPDPMLSKAHNYLKTCSYASRIYTDYSNLEADSLNIIFLHRNELRAVDRAKGFEWSGAFEVQYTIRNRAGAVLKKRETAQVNVIHKYMVLNFRDSGDFDCLVKRIDEIPV